jgi:hypothetical protein
MRDLLLYLCGFGTLGGWRTGGGGSFTPPDPPTDDYTGAIAFMTFF